MRGRKLPLKTIDLLKLTLKHHLARRFECEHLFSSFLEKLGIGRSLVNPVPLPIILEGALWGALVKAGTLTSTVILSDDAGQFKFGIRALCWVHAERHLQKLCGLSDAPTPTAAPSTTSNAKSGTIIDSSMSTANIQIQSCGNHCARSSIKSSKTKPVTLRSTGWLQRLYKKKSELLRALDYPHTPLHNNLGYADKSAMPTLRCKGLISLERTVRFVGIVTGARHSPIGCFRANCQVLAAR